MPHFDTSSRLEVNVCCDLTLNREKSEEARGADCWEGIQSRPEQART